VPLPLRSIDTAGSPNEIARSGAALAAREASLSWEGAMSACALIL